MKIFLLMFFIFFNSPIYALEVDDRNSARPEIIGISEGEEVCTEVVSNGEVTRRCLSYDSSIGDESFLDNLFEVVSSTSNNSSDDGTSPLEDVLCNILELLQGGIGKGIAAFAIIFMGISLFLGKVSWGLAISTALGIGAMFGAISVVDAISENDNDNSGFC